MRRVDKVLEDILGLQDHLDFLDQLEGKALQVKRVHMVLVDHLDYLELLVQQDLQVRYDWQVIKFHFWQVT